MAKEITFLPMHEKQNIWLVCLTFFAYFFCVDRQVLGRWKVLFISVKYPYTFYLSYFYFCQLEKDCFKWLEIIPRNFKTRNILKKLKNNREILIKSYDFIKYIIFGELSFFQIPWNRILAMKGNST